MGGGRLTGRPGRTIHIRPTARDQGSLVPASDALSPEWAYRAISSTTPSPMPMPTTNAPSTT